ncbi:MAG: metal-dependent hydrolase [Candidatus ainarchaeum sp.]|nr:metal-dependent hydrolase [Candidatus ainarchaeum sp.]
MNYKEHLVFSLFANAAVLFVLYLIGFTVDVSPLLIAVFGIFTLLPDIDHRHSMASRIFFAAYTGLFLVSIVLRNTWGIALALSLFLIHIAISRDDHQHRGIPHTLAFGAIACLILFLISRSFPAALIAALSFLSHVISDKHIRLL